MKKKAGIPKKKFKDLLHIDEQFFNVNPETGVAHIELLFDRPDEIFDRNYLSGTPILSDDFLDWIGSAFGLLSDKYRIDLTVRFRKMGDYTGEDLKEIFWKNIDLELFRVMKKTRARSRIAMGLIATGTLFFIAMLLISNLWKSASVWKDLFVYVSDIATTVTFWEAMTILVVEQKEERAYLQNLASRFSEIRFLGEEGKGREA